jgi:glycine/D-amino acid oxidase-like deaminating enzyme
LSGAVGADVCVVGLGGSGLAALEELHSLGVNAIGLDAHGVGAGAAGRNGGFILAGLAGFFHDLAPRFGRDLATAIYRETIEEIERQAREFPGIVRLTGSLRLAADAAEIQDCRKHLATLRDCGFAAEWYSGSEGEGVLLPTDGVMQPLERLRLIAGKLRAAGVPLYEGTPVRQLSPGQVTAAGGVVHCNTVLVAVDGGLEKIFPELSPRVRTARLQMLGTAPAPEVSFSRPIYWRNGYEYWQQRPDGAIALGGFRDHSPATEWTDAREPSDLIQGLLETFLREHLKVRAPITHRWAAGVAYTEDGLPVLEEVRPKIWAAGAYNGTGNIVGVLCARAAARRACGKSSEWAGLIEQARG